MLYLPCHIAMNAKESNPIQHPVTREDTAPGETVNTDSRFYAGIVLCQNVKKKVR